MQSVKTKNTGPEMIVRQMLHGLGYRYRLHVKTLPGKPDIVFPSRKKAIFVNGCFWHGHNCRIGQPPKSRQEYWLPKIAANKDRDQQKATELTAMGWSVFAVWQCETREPDTLREKLISFVGVPNFRADNGGENG